MGKKKFLLIVVIVAGIFFCLIYRVNAKYPNPTEVKAEGSMEYNSMEYTVEAAGFYAEQEVEKLWPDETFEHYRGYFVRLAVKNNGTEPQKIGLGDFELVSENAFTQGVDLRVFLDVNGEEVRENVYIEPGETGRYIFPFLVVNANFTNKQWKMLDTEQFGLVLALYPEKKELIL